jgi:predicted helicase
MAKILYETLRSHQQLAANAITAGVSRGQVILPTGVGKTRVQVYKILCTIQSSSAPTVSVIASHRILLCEQLIQEVIKATAIRDINFNILTVASDGVDLQDVAALVDDLNTSGDLGTRCLVERCTSNAEILAFAEKTRKLNRHLLVVSTYHSFDRMAGLPVDVACLDEAHTITEEDKHENVKAMLPFMSQAFFFTATRVIGLNGRGMNNTAFYGQVLCNVAPRAAIDTHDILPPVLHTINLEEGKLTDRNILQAAYKAHRAEVLRVSRGRLNPKMLVSVAGVEDMVGLLKDNAFHQWALQNGINTVGFSSSMGYYVNGLEVGRKEALQAVRNLKDEDSAIIMHYDILTEGIDLPTITGVMPLRELNKVKFLQTLGRAARLQADDRLSIYSGSSVGSGVGADGRVIADSSLVKPYYWVILSPKLNELATDANQSLVDIIRTSYQVEPEERSQPQLSTTSTTADAESVLPKAVLTPKEVGVTQYSHVFEALVFQAMSVADQKSTVETLLKGMTNVSQNQVPKSTTNPPVPEACASLPQAGDPVPRRPGKSSYDSFLGL